MYSTNTVTSDGTFVLNIDKCLGINHNIWLSRFCKYTYPSSSLINLDRMTIEFCNSKGEKLQACIILQFNIKINDIFHRINIIFGYYCGEKLHGIVIQLPMRELHNFKNWYKYLFNKLVSHLDVDIQTVMHDNYDLLMGYMEQFSINKLVYDDITNNVFFKLGVVHNELNTLPTF